MFTFFFLCSSPYGGFELLHPLFCFAAWSWHSQQVSSWGKQWWSWLLSVGQPSFSWMQIQTFISLTTAPEILPVICICWLLLWSMSGIDFIFVVFFSCMNFFCFLSFLLVVASFLHLYLSIQSLLLSSFEKFLNFWFVEIILPCFSGPWETVLCLLTSIFFSSYN